MIGRVLGRYRLVRELGAGGMGTVYEAVHTELNRRVAVKVLHTQESASPEKLARFFNEAKTASLIEHRNVVSVFEFDRTPEGAAYIIMEYLAGDSLRLRLQKQPSQVQQKALFYSRQMAAALAATHRKQVIHRDRSQISISHLRCTARTSQRRRDTDAAPHRSHASPYSYIL